MPFFPKIIPYVFFTIIVAILIIYLGWIDGQSLLNISMGAIALTGLLLILKLPWDLYFEARNLLAEQRESMRKEITIPDDDLQYTQSMVRKLLPFAISLHIMAAAIIATITYFSDGQIGYYFAAFFLLSTSFRPILAFHNHQKNRLSKLRRHCKVPREDAVNFSQRIKELESLMKENKDYLDNTNDENKVSLQKINSKIETLYALIKSQNRDYQDKVDTVMHEFGRSIEKLTEDKEILQGMRTLIKLIKSTPA
ncbi:MAG: hypothetical protein Q9M28_04935 [Mariprofundaceae bacterium]|nr:hypothetical protein [Mariprofundaceae bacterium]